MFEHLNADISSSEHLGPLPSLIGIVIMNGAFLAVAAFCWWRLMHFRRARIAAEQLVAQVTLQRGRVAVRGVVKLPSDQKHAMRVDVDSLGSEYSVKGGMRYQWKEVARRVSFTRFIVRTETGQELAVDPTASTVLIEPLFISAKPDINHRTQSAELGVGRDVWIVGQLGEEVSASGELSDLREPPRRWVLRAETLSTEPIQEKFAARSAFYRRWLGIALGTLALMQLLFAGYYVRSLVGHVVDAPVIARDTYRCGKNGRSTCYRVIAQVNGERFSASVRPADYNRISEGDTVPVTVVDAWSWLNGLGTQPGQSMLALFAVLGVWIAGTVRFFGQRRLMRPWYWQKKLAYNGAGRLSEN